MAKLKRVGDGKGDQGSSVQAFRINPETNKLESKHVEKPIVGWGLRVGSVSARSYSDQDWWMTTPVTEILEEKTFDKSKYMKFKTKNSIYELWS